MRSLSWILTLSAICGIWFAASIATGMGLDTDYTFRGVAVVASLVVLHEVVSSLRLGRIWL